MNARLKDAIREIGALPVADQQELADGIIAYARLVRSGTPLLLPEQREGVEAARAEARAGVFASDTEMDEAWRAFEE